MGWPRPCPSASWCRGQRRGRGGRGSPSSVPGTPSREGTLVGFQGRLRHPSPGGCMLLPRARTRVRGRNRGPHPVQSPGSLLPGPRGAWGALRSLSPQGWASLRADPGPPPPAGNMRSPPLRPRPRPRRREGDVIPPSPPSSCTGLAPAKQEESSHPGEPHQPPPTPGQEDERRGASREMGQPLTRQRPQQEAEGHPGQQAGLHHPQATAPQVHLQPEEPRG